MNTERQQITETRLAEATQCIEYEAARFAEFYGVEREDLVQEGFIGALHADSKFDASRGVKFVTYASFWIRKRMNLFAAATTGPIKLSYHLKHKYRIHFPCVSLEQEATEDFTYADVIGQDETTRAAVDNIFTGKLLKRVLGELSDRDRQIMIMRYWENKSRIECAAAFGLTRQGIDLIENGALAKLKRLLRKQKEVAL